MPGPVAQWLERGAHNSKVAGSIPAGPTTLTRYAPRCNRDNGALLCGVTAKLTAIGFLLPSERRLQAPERVRHQLRHDVPVDLHRHPDIRVAEDLHHHARVDVKGEEE